MIIDSLNKSMSIYGREYLYFDESGALQKKWLNLFQVIFRRCFGWYQETHKNDLIDRAYSIIESSSTHALKKMALLCIEKLGQNVLRDSGKIKFLFENGRVSIENCNQEKLGNWVISINNERNKLKRNIEKVFDEVGVIIFSFLDFSKENKGTDLVSKIFRNSYVLSESLSYRMNITPEFYKIFGQIPQKSRVDLPQKPPLTKTNNCLNLEASIFIPKSILVTLDPNDYFLKEAEREGQEAQLVRNESQSSRTDSLKKQIEVPLTFHNLYMLIDSLKDKNPIFKGWQGRKEEFSAWSDFSSEFQHEGIDSSYWTSLKLCNNTNQAALKEQNLRKLSSLEALVLLVAKRSFRFNKIPKKLGKSRMFFIEDKTGQELCMLTYHFNKAFIFRSKSFGLLHGIGSLSGHFLVASITSDLPPQDLTS